MREETNKKLMEQAQILLINRGHKAFEMARNAILEEKSLCMQVYKALRYFVEESWYDVQHPALIYMACEAVGGDPSKTINIGSAMVLLAGAADIHDDIIDKSKVKDGKPTVFGEFGKDIAILAGDALLFKGLILLYNACESLTKEQSKAVIDLAKKAFFKVGNAETEEIILKKKKYKVIPEEYYKIIETKAAVSEASMQIGAIIGGGNRKEINALGYYGKTLGILMTIRNDFIDIFEPDELRNRIKNECLPLPVLYALQDEGKTNEIKRLLRKKEITEKETQVIMDLIMDVKNVQELKRKMKLLIESAAKILDTIRIKKNKENFNLLLHSTLEDL